MASAVNSRSSKPIGSQPGLMSLASETRVEIFREVFRGLEVQLNERSRARPQAGSTLVNICQVCHTFLAEARPIFLDLVRVITVADVSLRSKIRRLSVEDCHSIRNLVILVTKEHSHDYSSITAFLTNIEQLTIELTPWRPGYLDIEGAMKSKDTVVITDSDADYDENKRIGVNRLFAAFEDWVKDLVIDHASVNSKETFKLVVRLDFVNEPDENVPITTLKCEIDILSRTSTIETPGRKTVLFLKLPVLIGKGLHPNAVREVVV